MSRRRSELPGWLLVAYNSPGQSGKSRAVIGNKCLDGRRIGCGRRARSAAGNAVTAAPQIEVHAVDDAVPVRIAIGPVRGGFAHASLPAEEIWSSTSLSPSKSANSELPVRVPRSARCCVDGPLAAALGFPNGLMTSSEGPRRPPKPGQAAPSSKVNTETIPPPASRSAPARRNSKDYPGTRRQLECSRRSATGTDRDSSPARPPPRRQRREPRERELHAVVERDVGEIDEGVARVLQLDELEHSPSPPISPAALAGQRMVVQFGDVEIGGLAGA